MYSDLDYFLSDLEKRSCWRGCEAAVLISRLPPYAGRKTPGGGPALLFEKPTGSDIPA